LLQKCFVIKKGLLCHFKVFGIRKRISSEAELALFRIAQESLRNISKHSEADNAVLRVQFKRHSVKLSVIDKGIGFNIPDTWNDFTKAGKLGVIGMAERIKQLEGSFKIRSEIGKGTSIITEVPS
jgi:two-component system sensor histidine kinase DegS